jgi:hypothetical protein
MFWARVFLGVLIDCLIVAGLLILLLRACAGAPVGHIQGRISQALPLDLAEWLQSGVDIDASSPTNDLLRLSSSAAAWRFPAALPHPEIASRAG